MIKTKRTNSIFLLFYLFFNNSFTQFLPTEGAIELQGYSKSKAQSLAQELYRAQQQKNPKKFINLLNQAVDQFRSSPESFRDFLFTTYDNPNTPWTALMFAAVMGDDIQIQSILKALENYYENDQSSIAEYLNYTEKTNGNTALIFAADFGNDQAFKTLVNGASKLLKGNKPLFLNFLIHTDFKNENNPLILLTKDSTSNAIQFLIKKAEDFFGQKSPEYHKFINWHNRQRGTALAYTFNPEDKYFLVQHGATLRYFPQKVQTAEALGDQLIQALNFGSVKQLETIIQNAIKTFGNKKYLYLDMLNRRDDAGWNALMHAGADKKLILLKILLSFSIKELKDPFNLYRTIATVDMAGENILFLDLEHHHFEAIKLLIKEIKSFIPNKYWLYNFLATQDQRRGFTSLTAAVYNSSDEKEYENIIRFILKTMDELFGKNSRPFFLFINQLDLNNRTALDYANTPEIHNLLYNYGALTGEEVVKIHKKEESLLFTFEPGHKAPRLP